MDLRFDSPDDVAESSVAAEASFGALRQSRRFACRTAALLCNARVARKCVPQGAVSARLIIFAWQISFVIAPHNDENCDQA